MTAPTPNAELAYRVLDLARANAESFDMGSWAWRPDGEPVSLDDLTKHDCGTVACLAGWTAAAMGYRVDSGANVFDSAGNQVSSEVDLFAAQLLGIDVNQASILFFSYDSQVEQRVTEIFGPRPRTCCASTEQAGHDFTCPTMTGDGQDWSAAARSWRECAHRADYTSAAHHERECAYHRGEVDEWGLPVDDVPPNAGSAS